MGAHEAQDHEADDRHPSEDDDVAVGGGVFGDSEFTVQPLVELVLIGGYPAGTEGSQQKQEATYCVGLHRSSLESMARFSVRSTNQRIS